MEGGGMSNEEVMTNLDLGIAKIMLNVGEITENRNYWRDVAQRAGTELVEAKRTIAQLERRTGQLQRDLDDLIEEAEDSFSLRKLQSEQAEWSQRQFGEQPSVNALLGAMEELGELSHAHLKRLQGIRGSFEELTAKAKDAVGDITVFLADYCSKEGFDYQQIVKETWEQVSRRDWTKDKEKGGTE
jgi:chromosome segregation ATPase